jgi:hypothetical protein
LQGHGFSWMNTLMGMAGSYVDGCFTFKKPHNCFLKWLWHFASPPVVCERSSSSILLLLTTGMTNLLDFTSSCGYEVVLHCDLNYLHISIDV